jgi:hypothetical protein
MQEAICKREYRDEKRNASVNTSVDGRERCGFWKNVVE